MIEQRPDFTLEVVPVGGVHFRGDSDPAAACDRDGNRTVDALLRRDASEKRQIAARTRVKLEEPCREPMMNGGRPPRVGQRLSLGVRDGDHRYIAEFSIQRAQLVEIEPSVQSGHVRALDPADDGEVELRDVEVDDIELVGALSDLFQHEHMRGQGVFTICVQTERSAADRYELGRRPGIPAGKQRHVVTLPHELIRQE